MQQIIAKKESQQFSRLAAMLLVPLIGISTLVACGGSSGNPPQETTGQISAEENESNGNNSEQIDSASDQLITQPNSQLTSVARLPSGGHLSNPEFQWPAVENASSYRLVIEDNRGDQISEQLTSQQAGCIDTSDACRFTPSVQIHDSILVWRTESFDASGAFIKTSEDVSFNTLRSLTAQPFTRSTTLMHRQTPDTVFQPLSLISLLHSTMTGMHVQSTAMHGNRLLRSIVRSTVTHRSFLNTTGLRKVMVTNSL